MTMRLAELQHVTQSPRTICTVTVNERSIRIIEMVRMDIAKRPELYPAHTLMVFPDKAGAKEYFIGAGIPSDEIVFMHDERDVPICSFKHWLNGSSALPSWADWEVLIGSRLREEHERKVALQIRAVFGPVFMPMIEAGQFPWGPPPRPRSHSGSMLPRYLRRHREVRCWQDPLALATQAS